MRIEKAQPLFGFLDGGLFIRQANTLVDQYDLRRRWDRSPGDLILGPQIGRLDNRQNLHLLTLAVSRLIGNLPRVAAGQDCRVHETIQALYGGFCKTFLEEFPHQSEEHTLLLRSFLDRVVEIYLGQPPTIEYSALNHERWKFLTDAGARLLEHQFPIVPQRRPLEALAGRGCESELGWLEEAGEKLRFELTRCSHFRTAEHVVRRFRPGRTKAWHRLCKQFEWAE